MNNDIPETTILYFTKFCIAQILFLEVVKTQEKLSLIKFSNLNKLKNNYNRLVFKIKYFPKNFFGAHIYIYGFYTLTYLYNLLTSTSYFNISSKTFYYHERFF